MSIRRAVPARKNPYYSNVFNQAIVTVGAEISNAINVAYAFKDPNKRALVASVHVDVYLSDNADGSTIAASAPSGGWAIGTNGLLIPIVTNKFAKIITKSDGTFDVTVTEVSVKTFYIIVCFPDGSITSTPVAFA